MNHPKNISILDYTYTLPAERIALHPLPERDASRLLIYQNGKIEQDQYKHIDKYLPAGSLLIFNNSKVIKARILFQKSSGGVIEIFCLEPFEDMNEYSSIMNRKGRVKWKCMIGGAGKWKEGELKKELTIDNKPFILGAKLTEKLSDAFVVEFSWKPAELCFAEVLERSGETPLPPYIKRKPDEEDTGRYQTIYAKDEGSVAAPTAGLHFTEEIFNRLAEKNIHTDYITLHVGAGTFKPVKATTLEGHEMHAEWIEVNAELIERLILKLGSPIVAVGTTSLRTLESLYWLGIKSILQPGIKKLILGQWEVYEETLTFKNIPVKEALTSLLNWLKKNSIKKLFTRSQLLIVPGYEFKVADTLITNFHQPQSTLLLLVAAAAGNSWIKIYDHALQNGFRFLSYGDGCLLFIDK